MIAVVPFRAGGKSRLPRVFRRELALAMLADVVEAALDAGGVRVVTGDVDGADLARELGAQVVPDPGGGQGAAVAAALDGLAGLCLVVNADLPCATSAALERFAVLAGALVAAPDGTTNALALLEPAQFVDLYGPGSAERFAATGLVAVSVPELERDVDTLDDIDDLTLPTGRRTTLVLNRRELLLPHRS